VELGKFVIKVLMTKKMGLTSTRSLGINMLSGPIPFSLGNLTSLKQLYVI
jgi:hypothetical protein